MRQPEVINKLQRALKGGEQYLLEVIPDTLARIIEQNIWRQCADRQGRPFKNFEAFVAHPLTEGLESSIEELKHHCFKRQDVVKILEAELQPAKSRGAQQGNGNASKNGVDNRNFDSSPDESKGGTKAVYTLRRLKRDRPDLADRVVRGELTAKCNNSPIQIPPDRTPGAHVAGYWISNQLRGVSSLATVRLRVGLAGCSPLNKRGAHRTADSPRRRVTREIFRGEDISPFRVVVQIQRRPASRAEWRSCGAPITVRPIRVESCMSRK